MLELNENDEVDYDITLFINYPILVDAHEHPLLLCTCQRSSDFDNDWDCNECDSSFSLNTPSFYCTYCDFDLCKECLGNYKLNQVKPLNEYLIDYENQLNDLDELSFPWQMKFPIHPHSLSLIKKINNKSKWKCQICGKFYKKNIDVLYYCSLCDYNICYRCRVFGKKNLSKKLSDNCPSKDVSTSAFSNCLEKRNPVIYLYPNKEMNISVQMEINVQKNNVTTVYPKFNAGNNVWKVLAKPNGDIILLNKKDKVYPYLFWEAESYDI